jgi:Tfp pilus assembly protein PilO
MIERLQSYRKYVYTVILIVMLAVLGVYVLILKPTVYQLEAMQHQFNVEFDEVEALHSQLQALQKDVDQKNSIELQKSIPVTPSIEQLILDLEHIEKQAGVNITDIAFSKETLGTVEESQSFSEELLKMVSVENTEYTSDDHRWLGKIKLTPIHFDIRITSSYLNLMKMLTLIEGLPRTIHVESIQFQSQLSNGMDSEELNEEITGTLSLTAYYAEQFAPYVSKTPESIVNPAVIRDNPLRYKE